MEGGVAAMTSVVGSRTDKKEDVTSMKQRL